MDAVRRIADAVLYEGYILWPYRRSAVKNQKRWTFGGLYPPAWSAEHPDDRAGLVAQVLLEGEPDVAVSVRFLHVVERSVRDAAGSEVAELEAGGERHLSWDEATERELAAAGGQTPFALPAGEEAEALAGGAGSIVRRWEPLRGSVEVAVEQLRAGIHRVTVEVANETPWQGADRDKALRRTLCSTHVVLRTERGAFVSQTDPPEALREAAAVCRNDGVWPVLVGPAGDRSTVLASPIILSDYAEIAPESPGDLFDATEIDRLLILNVLALTEEEQEEMRATDPRAAAILDRCRALGPEELLPLHGAIRELRAADP